jgi:hypothetical protein
MPAMNHLRDVTMAEDGPTTPSAREISESYAPATPGIPSRLIFPGPRMQVRTQIQFNRRRYTLRDVFVIDLSYTEDGEVFASHRVLPVHGYGTDQRAALDAFCEAFDFQWRHLVEPSEDGLTEGGRRRRKAMQEVVQNVEESS